MLSSTMSEASLNERWMSSLNCACCKYIACRPSSLHLAATRPAFRSHEGEAGFLYP